MVDNIRSKWVSQLIKLRGIQSITNFALSFPQPEYDGQWNSTTADKLVTLYIDRETCLGEPPYEDRYALWDDMFKPKDGNGDDAATALSINTLVIGLVAVALTIANYY